MVTFPPLWQRVQESERQKTRLPHGRVLCTQEPRCHWPSQSLTPEAVWITGRPKLTGLLLSPNRLRPPILKDKGCSRKPGQAGRAGRAERAGPAGPSGKTASQPSAWGPASQGSTEGWLLPLLWVPPNLQLQQGEDRVEKLSAAAGGSHRLCSAFSETHLQSSNKSAQCRLQGRAARLRAPTLLADCRVIFRRWLNLSGQMIQEQSPYALVTELRT